MNIDLTKKQFQTLLELMYFGEWVANSYKTKEDKLYKETDNLEQYIFSYASRFGLEDWIEYDQRLKKYMPTLTMEEKFHPLIQKYNKRQIDLLGE
jgi:hypothetical protein